MHLLPQPRLIKYTRGTCPSSTLPGIAIDLSVDHPQGYRLQITPSQIEIAARSQTGVFYAQQTLKQLRSQSRDALPCLEIHDWPDFPVRGVMLDISRDKVPTLTTLFSLIDLLADWKINQLQLYTEHTFAYSAHRTVWQNASPLTGADIQLLDAYCRQRFIDLVPNQNSFGHMERWLRHAEYSHLAEAPDGAETPWGFRWQGPFSLCPTDPRTIDFLAGLYQELLPHFTSRLFNAGCDETFDIGQGRSKSECDRLGVHRVYLNFIQRVNRLAESNNKQMMFWGDVILHQPQLIAELPGNVIALEWGYEANHPFDQEGAAFAAAGIPYYVCPGTSTWNSITGRTDNAIANLKSAARSGQRHGAIGYLITDWGDNGHLQYQPTSYLGFLAGAAYSWCLLSNEQIDIPVALNHHAFKDPDATFGQLAYTLGNIYQFITKPNANGSSLFRLLVPSPSDPHPEKGITEADLKAAEKELDQILDSIPTHETDELTLIADEFRNAARMLQLCIEIGRDKLKLPSAPPINRHAIRAEHHRLWLARNRPGDLDDSLTRLPK